MALREHAEAIAQLATQAVTAEMPESAIRAGEQALRGLYTTQALLSAAAHEGFLAQAQLDILRSQAAKVRKALEEVVARARLLRPVFSTNHAVTPDGV